jgi:hypothetical protein
LLLASITGWDASARQVVTGKPTTGMLGMALIQRLGLIYLFDLQNGDLIHNTLDERTRRYAELFSPTLASEEIAEVARAVEKELGAYDSLGLDLAGQILPFSAQRIRQAFDELASTGRYSLTEIPQVGLTLVRMR